MLITPEKAAFDVLLASLPSINSKRAYEGVWLRFREWLAGENIPVLEVRPRHVAAYLAYLSTSTEKKKAKAKATISHALSVIREVFGAFVREELIEVNPAREVKMKRLSSDPRTPWMNEEEVMRLLAVPATTWKERRARLCVALLVGLGCRRAEIARLRVEDFRGDAVTLLVKGDKKHVLPVSTWLTREIVSFREYAALTTGALLPRSQKDATPINGDIVYKLVKSVARKADIPIERVTPHAIRRTAITLGVLEGISLDDLQHSAAHSSKATTERYVKAAKTSNVSTSEWMSRLIK